MKNFILVNAVQNSNHALLAFETKSLTPASAYRAIKLRCALKDAWEKYLEAEKGCLAEAGIDDAPSFDVRQRELLAKKADNTITEEEKVELDGMHKKVARYNELRDVLLNDEVDLSGVKAMPFEEWFKLKAENPCITADIENALIGIAYSEPTE